MWTQRNDSSIPMRCATSCDDSIKHPSSVVDYRAESISPPPLASTFSPGAIRTIETASAPSVAAGYAAPAKFPSYPCQLQIAVERGAWSVFGEPFSIISTCSPILTPISPPKALRTPGVISNSSQSNCASYVGRPHDKQQMQVSLYHYFPV